jgi:hypothetical protein
MYPLNGHRHISTGDVPIPYHVYDGQGMFIGGTADLATVAALIQTETLLPMRNQDGRALMGVWICDFTQASLGPHTELQFAFFASREPAPPISNHPFGPLMALLADPTARLLCHGLWNDSATAVAYNQELLGLPAQLSQAQIEQGNGRKRFNFQDVNGRPLLDGQVREDKRTAVRLVMELMRLFGFRRSLELAAAPELASIVVNPISPPFPHNLEARAIIATGTPVLQQFDPARDTLTIHTAPYANLGFTPAFIEHFAPFRFVYLMPG